MREKRRWPKLVKLVDSIRLYCEQNQSSWNNKCTRFIRTKVKELTKYRKRVKHAELDYKISLLIESLEGFKFSGPSIATKIPAISTNSNLITEFVNFELWYIS